MNKNKNKFNLKKTIALTVLVFMLLPIFSGCAESPSKKYLVDLEVWGSFDDNGDFSEIFAAFKGANPFVRNIAYKKIPVDSYENELMDALASGNGPDIFLVNNAWMPRYEDKVIPAPINIINEKQFRDTFVDVVATDFIGKNSEIYGVPLSVDSLGLYYNKDLFNAAGITTPPSTWPELLDSSKRITKINDVSEIERSGVAMGTVPNINRSTDIIDLLMLQNGAQLPDKNNMSFRPDFNIGKNMLEFYTQFARFSSPAYSWNKSLHYSIDAFYEGDLGMMLNYSWHINTIKNKNAKLNFALAPIPQISSSKPINYANYWSFVVNKNKQIKQVDEDRPISNEIRAHEAWQFLRFLTMPNNGKFIAINYKTKSTKDYPVNIDPAAYYVDRTKKPAGRRDLVEKQKTDPILGPFAYGNLIAKTWYKKNSNLIETVWASVVEDINRGNITPEQGFSQAVYRINQINGN